MLPHVSCGRRAARLSVGLLLCGALAGVAQSGGRADAEKQIVQDRTMPQAALLVMVHRLGLPAELPRAPRP